MSRRPNTDVRRAEIVRAMLPVLAREGYEGASIQAVAKQAGLTPGLLHYHFKTKQDILVALVAHMTAFVRERYEAQSGKACTPGERLKAYLDVRLALGRGADAEIAAAWVMIGAEAVRQPEVRKVYQEAVQQELHQLTGLLSACLKDKKRDSRKAAHLAAGLAAFMGGAFQLSAAAAEVMPKGYAAAQAWEFAQSVIDAQPRKV